MQIWIVMSEHTVLVPPGLQLHLLMYTRGHATLSAEQTGSKSCVAIRRISLLFVHLSAAGLSKHVAPQTRLKLHQHCTACLPFKSDALVAPEKGQSALCWFIHILRQDIGCDERDEGSDLLQILSHPLWLTRRQSRG